MIHAAVFALAIATAVGVFALFIQLMLGGGRIRRLDDQPPVVDGPLVSVIVAARDEGPNIERALRSLLDQAYRSIEIIAVDDRSADDTGAILDRLARAEPRLRVVHITDLPAGWLGKNNAMHQGAALATGEYVLFTDGDVVFHTKALGRAVEFMRVHELDHLTVGPELESPSNLLALVVNFFAVGFLLYFRPWHVPNPKRSEALGIGAFNMLRTSVYRGFGGHARIALRPDDDLKLGKLVKLAGAKSMVAGGVGVIRVKWYATIGELARGLRKNTFAGLNYSLPMAVGGVVTQIAVNVWPFVALFLTSGVVWWLNLFVALLLMTMYAAVATSTASNPWLAIGYPIAAVIFVYIVIAATWHTLSRGGIEWRGTFYPLDELRKNTL